MTTLELENTTAPEATTPAHRLTQSPAHDLLQALVETLQRHVILPPHAAETLALWTLHTYAFHLRDVSTYVGIESPEKRCGKTTLLTLLSELCNRAIVSSNISNPAFFRVIAETRPTLLIDEADSFLQGNDELRGILNSGYTRKAAHVIRVINEPRNLTVGNQPTEILPSRTHSLTHLQTHASSSLSHSHTTRFTDSPTHEPAAPSPHSPLSLSLSLSPTLARFSTWCPKAIAAIGHLPDTLADRCIIIRMQRKTTHEQTQRLRHLDTTALREQCETFVARHANQIAAAQPEIPNDLNDRAADIWEPLLVLADIAGGDWPAKARCAAVALSTRGNEADPIGALFMDLLLYFARPQLDRAFSRDVVEYLNYSGIRPWNETLKKPVNELWLAQQLRPYGIFPRTIRLDDRQAKGYYQSDMLDAFRRYIPKSEIDRIHEEFAPEQNQDQPSTGSADTHIPENQSTRTAPGAGSEHR